MPSPSSSRSFERYAEVGNQDGGDGTKMPPHHRQLLREARIPGRSAPRPSHGGGLGFLSGPRAVNRMAKARSRYTMTDILDCRKYAGMQSAPCFDREGGFFVSSLATHKHSFM